MDDIECPQCGHRALSVATRCPRCGHEFSAELLHRPPQGPARPWLRPTLGAGGVAAAVLLLLLVARVGGGGGTGSTGRTGGIRPSQPPPDSAAPAPAPAAAVPAARSPNTRPDSSPRTVPLPAAEPRPAPPSPATLTAPLRRYATNWINVRLRRGLEAPPISVLQPGDAVLVDSLVRGWYRVIVDGRTFGYAHRRYLASTPPDGPPSP